MLASEQYYSLTRKRYVYNIMPLANISSVLRHGIVCFEQAQTLQHISVALEDVQSRRCNVVIPGGAPLHQYANLYFSYSNPMLYRRKENADELCILAVSATVLDMDGCILSDRNAATSFVRFFSSPDGLQYLNFTVIHGQYWTDADPFIYREKKAIKCAEVLIPHCVPTKYIAGAYVVSNDAESQLLDSGFLRPIAVRPKVFFRKENGS